MNASVQWYSREEENCYVNFRSMITKNSGHFKSEKQAHFILGGGLVVPVTSAPIPGLTPEQAKDSRRKLTMEQYGIVAEPNTAIIVLHGSISFASYGHRSQRRHSQIFVLDNNGVIAQYKLHYTYKNGIAVAPERTEVVWERQHVEAPNYKDLTVAIKEKEEAKRVANAHTKFIGEIKQRMYFEGLVKEIKFLGYTQIAFHTVAQHRTTIITDDGNVIVHWNEIGEQGKRIRFKATIKDHTEYNGVKQTVVLRPADITISEYTPPQHELQFTVKAE